MMKKQTILLALMLVACLSASAQKKFSAYGVGFYNLENLFDITHDEGKNDYEFLPEGSYKWNEMKYTHKLHNMARVLSELGTDVLPGVGCAVIGVSEVENAHCLDDLVAQPELAARGYKYVHVEGPDQRGVDCAMLYNPALFEVEDVTLYPYVYELQEDIEKNRATRGFLTVKGTLAGEDVAIIVNHLPSRFAVSYYREEGGRQIREVKEELQRENPNVKIFIMGDMNDDPQDKSMAEALGAVRKIKDVDEGGLWNPWWDVLASGTGTLQYDGGWNLFDQIILSQTLLDTKHMKSGKPVDLKKIDTSTLKYYGHQIFRRDYLFQREGRYKGNTKRTHAGGVWLDGYSDHLPTVVYLVKEAQ